MFLVLFVAIQSKNDTSISYDSLIRTNKELKHQSKLLILDDSRYKHAFVMGHLESLLFVLKKGPWKVGFEKKLQGANLQHRISFKPNHLRRDDVVLLIKQSSAEKSDETNKIIEQLIKVLCVDQQDIINLIKAIMHRVPMMNKNINYENEVYFKILSFEWSEVITKIENGEFLDLSIEEVVKQLLYMWFYENQINGPFAITRVLQYRDNLNTKYSNISYCPNPIEWDFILKSHNIESIHYLAHLDDNYYPIHHTYSTGMSLYLIQDKRIFHNCDYISLTFSDELVNKINNEEQIIYQGIKNYANVSLLKDSPIVPKEDTWCYAYHVCRDSKNNYRLVCAYGDNLILPILHHLRKIIHSQHFLDWIDNSGLFFLYGVDEHSKVNYIRHLTNQIKELQKENKKLQKKRKK